jgi:hypothetical protein
MFRIYRNLRSYCQQHEWAAALSAVVLVGLLGSVIAVAIEYHSAIGHWLLSDILVHGLLLILAMLAIGFISASIFCLSHSQCSIQDRREKVVYRNKPVMSKQLRVIKNLGVNPRRQHRPVRNASS